MSDTWQSPYVPLVQSLLEALGLHGLDRKIIEAMPHEHRRPSVDDLRNTLSHLKIDLFEARTNLRRLAKDDCPCLFIDDKGNVSAVVDKNGAQLRIQFPHQPNPEWADAPDQKGRMIKLVLPEEELVTAAPIGLSKIWGQKRLVSGLLLASLLTNLFAFGTPLFVMTLYDRIMPVGSPALLFSILVGLGVILVGDLAIRLIRAKTIAFLGAKVEFSMGIQLFDKLMSLPLSMLQKSDVSQQITRFRQFEGLRDAFTGSVLSSFLDLPFTLIFLVVIFNISPVVGTLVMILALVFALAYAVTLPAQKHLGRLAALSKAEQQKLVMELAGHQRSLRRLGAEELWRERLQERTRVAARAARISRQFGLITQTFGQTLMMVAGATTIVYGTVAAMAGDMTMGALIASMALVWRVLSPIHALYTAAPQINGFIQSAAQSNRLLQIEGELTRTASEAALKSFEGNLTGRGLVFRYGNTTDPALAGITFNFEPGEKIAIAGPNGSGKSTLLNLIDGLNTAQAGALLIDNIDYRQIPVEDLRASISYAPQVAQFFHGTIAQNLLLNNPLATEAEVWQALVDAGLEQDIRHLPEGVNTRLSEEFRSKLSPAILRAMVLARTFIRKAPIYMFDEPFNGLDSAKQDAFFRKLDRIDGQATVILVTQRPSHYIKMDRVLYFDQGRVIVDEKSDIAAKKIQALEALQKRL